MFMCSAIAFTYYVDDCKMQIEFLYMNGSADHLLRSPPASDRKSQGGSEDHVAPSHAEPDQNNS